MDHAYFRTRSRLQTLDWCLLTTLGVSAPLVGVLLLSREAPGVPSALMSSAVFLYPILLLSAALAYHHWWRTGDPIAGRLVLGLTFVGVPGLALPALVGSRPGEALSDLAWLSVLDLVAVLAVVVLVRAPLVGSAPRDPLGTGLALGLAMVVVQLVVVHAAPGWRLGSIGRNGLGLAVLLAHVALAVVLLRRVTPGRSLLRWCLAVAVVLFGASRAIASSEAAPTHHARVLALLVDAGCAMALMSVIMTFLITSLMAGDDAVDDLYHQVALLEKDARDARARLHEISATLAGINSANTLMHSKTSLTPPRRQRLDDMMQAELSRLQRLMQEPEPHRVVDLDEAIRHLVVSHEARGHPVVWQPAHLEVRGRSDAITEIVSILLDNAVQHGSTQARLDFRADERCVRILVSDSGPGVSPEVSRHLFDWGVRGPSSAGRGFGLHIARQLAQEQGGSVHLQETSCEGSTFVVELLTHRRVETTHEHTAHTA